MEKPWEGAFEPFKVFGNTWFTGTIPASTHLIDTGAGLIIINSGYQETLYLMLESTRRLGFDPADIRYILHSHGHIDHAGATRALVELTKAKTFIGAGDYDIVTGKRPLSWAPEYNMAFNGAFEALNAHYAQLVGEGASAGENAVGVEGAAPCINMSVDGPEAVTFVAVRFQSRFC